MVFDIGRLERHLGDGLEVFLVFQKKLGVSKDRELSLI
jgi:hypothetical protein